MITDNKKEIDRLLSNAKFKLWYENLMTELKAEEDLYKLIEDCNIQYFNTATIKDIPSTMDDDELNVEELKWEITVPVSKKAREKGNYELCVADKTNPLYKKLMIYISTNREGYAPVIYNGYSYSIIKTGISRRKIK